MPPSWFEIRRLDRNGQRSAVAIALSERGVEPTASSVQNLVDLLQDSTFTAVADSAVDHVRASAHPEQALLGLSALASSLRQRGDFVHRLWTPTALHVTTVLAGASPWAREVMARDPDGLFRLVDAVQAGATHKEPLYDPSLPLRNGPEQPSEFDRHLRRVRNRGLLALAYEELQGVDVRWTSRRLSELAAGCIDAALRFHRRRLESRFGPLTPPCRNVVMGMGKLGGGELNFSSDVDLIYVYEHDESRAGELTAHEWHVKLFEALGQSLQLRTEDGFVFRVDVDLRPEGRQGPLAHSMQGLERYYESWGRTWERAAWIRARPVAGDPSLGQEVLQMLRPFVYRRSRDLAQVKALVNMKSDIDQVQRRRSRTGAVDLKLGPGGIREAEFFVQAHQLLFGGHQPELREPGTLDALEALVATGHISAQARDRLDQAYRWLRRVEHRLQLKDDQQVHTLPSRPEDLQWLARTLGLSTERFRAELDRNRAEVTALFERVLGRVEDANPLPEPLYQVVDSTLPAPQRLDAAHRLGALRPEAAVASIDRCLRIPGTPLYAHPEPTGLRLLLDCFESPLPDRALAHLPPFLVQLRQHHSYLQQLERAELRRGVARLLGTSDLLAQILVSNPRLLRLVMMQTQIPGPDQIPALLSEFCDLDDELETCLEQLRRFKQQELLRTAVFDLAGALSLSAVEARLTRLAECIVQQCADLATRQMTARYGPPPPGCSLVILAGGALGAREMSYRTDVDLAAIRVGEGDTEGGPWGKISVFELWTKVVQRLVSYLTLPMSGGDLYPVDMRLRPSGNQGTLLTSLPSFQRYHARSAQLWERQSLVRTRTIYGATQVQVQEAVDAAAYRGPAPRRDEVHAMKERLAAEHRGSTRPDAELKYGPGGMVELQFLLQYLQLREGGEHPELRTSETRKALRELARVGLLETETAESLVASYGRLRREQNLLRLLQDTEVHRRHAARAADRDEMPLAEARHRIRQSYSRIMGRH